MNVRLSAKQIEMHDYQAHDPSQDETEVEIETDDEHEHGVVPHGEVGASAAELARNLPELVENLRRLRLEMEKCNKFYESINLSQRASGKIHSNGGDLSPPGSGDERPSLADMYGYDDSKLLGSALDGVSEDGSVGPPPMTRGSSVPSMTTRRSLYQAQPPALRSSLRISTLMQQSVSYSVMWVSGECGISLRNFSTNKIGAQIAVLQQADGVTTGISNCRLGDQLIFVNDDRVEDMRFKDIVQKLKSTRRPITLGFRMNQNVQTSPTSASSSAATRSTNSSMSRTSSSRGFFSGGHNSEYDEYVTSSANAAMTDLGLDRQTYGSMRSSTSTLSDDVELFCKEQEEMHSDIIVLLTETVLRCEKLQQQNLDQLQSLMQLAPNVHPQSSSSQDADPALSSLAPVESPAAAVKIRASMTEAASLNGSFHARTATTATSA